MKQFAQTYYLLQFIICLSISCGEGGNDNYSETMMKGTRNLK